MKILILNTNNGWYWCSFHYNCCLPSFTGAKAFTTAAENSRTTGSGLATTATAAKTLDATGSSAAKTAAQTFGATAATAA